MARPKSTAPTKIHLNLTVTQQTRLELDYIAAHNGCSISQLIADWATKEARKVAKATKTEAPSTEQLSLKDL